MLEPHIIYETENFLAVDKPAGLIVHAAKHKKPIPGIPESETLVDWVIARYPKIKTVGDDPVWRPGIVHRLDKDTSGVMIVAKNQVYFEYLKSLFQQHLVQKTYYAVAVGEFSKEQGIIDAPIGIVNGTLKRSVRSTKMQKEAITEYRVIEKIASEDKDAKPRTLLEIHPKTGRTHQIRVHLASIGHPIVGDKLYGRTSGDRLMLHAARIAFPEQDGTMVHIEAELPKGFWELVFHRSFWDELSI